MRILHTKVSTAHWERDFGRVEARVHLLLQDDPKAKPRGESLLVSVPAHPRKDDRSLRERVHEEAALMAVLLNTVERNEKYAQAA